MNDEQRAALMEELGSVMHSLTNGDESLIQLVYTPNDYAEKVLVPIIDRLLADRAATVAEPDAETVEQAVSVYNDAVRVGLPDHIDPHRYAMKEALIAAMPSSCADADSSWLDDALDSVPVPYGDPVMQIYGGYQIGGTDGGYRCLVANAVGVWEGEPMVRYSESATHRSPTSAVLDAVQKAKEVQR